MTERYQVFKSGYLKADGINYADRELMGTHDTEELAIVQLREVEADVEELHYIERQEWLHIDQSIYDWESDEDYGELGCKRLYMINQAK